MGMKKIIEQAVGGLTTEGKIAYGCAALFVLVAGFSALFPGVLPPMPEESLPMLAGIFGISFGKSKSNNVASNAAAGYDMSESAGMSGSEQISDSDSLGVNISQQGQNIYGPQAGYINDIYGQAQNLYANYGMPDRQVAGLNPMMGANAGFAAGSGNDIFTAQLMSALGNTGGYGAAANAAGRMSSGNVFDAPMTNGLNYNTLAASVNNPFLDGQIDAASRDVVRNLNENQLTGNASMAASTGNSGSTRRAVMDAIAARGAADRVADIGATMRGQAYGQGLGLANATALANQNAMMGTNSLNANLMGQGANLNFQLGQSGQQGLRDAYGIGSNNAGMMADTGNMLRQYQQQLLDTAYSNQMNPYNSLQMYKSFIGDPTVLSSGSSIGFDRSRSNSYGNSFNNSYSYGMGANTSAGSSTGSASSFNLGANFGGRG